MPYTIVQPPPSARKQILLSLWQRNFSPVTPSLFKERYQWLYENNPSGAPASFFLQNGADNSIIGAISLFPRTLFLDGEKISGFICGDFTVDKKHRTLGPAISLLNAAIQKCESNAPCVLLGIPNKKSEPVMRRAGFTILDNINEMTNVLSSYPYILKRIKTPVVAKIISHFLDPFLHLRSATLFMRTPKGQIVEIKHPDTRNAATRFLHKKHILSGERNTNFLYWRFMASPYASHHLFTVDYQDSLESSINHQSYIIFSVHGKRIRIADFFAPDKKTRRDLFTAFSCYAKALGSDSINFTFAGDAALVASFRKLGYSLRSKTKKMLIYSSGSNNQVERIKNGQWYLTSADNDI